MLKVCPVVVFTMVTESLQLVEVAASPLLTSFQATTTLEPDAGFDGWTPRPATCRSGAISLMGTSTKSFVSWPLSDSSCPPLALARKRR